MLPKSAAPFDTLRILTSLMVKFWFFFWYLTSSNQGYTKINFSFHSSRQVGHNNVPLKDIKDSFHARLDKQTLSDRPVKIRRLSMHGTTNRPTTDRQTDRPGHPGNPTSRYYKQNFWIKKEWIVFDGFPLVWG